jgi:predicted DNA-binding transcriptional regulator YafY
MRLRLEEYDWLVRILLMLGTEAKVLTAETLYLCVQQEAQKIARHYSQL